MPSALIANLTDPAGLFKSVMENSIPSPDATADEALAEAAAERGQVG